MELNQKENLILQSYLNCILLTALKNNNFLESEYFNQLKLDDSIKTCLKQIDLDNQGMSLMHLYSMLVLPRERIFNDYKNEFNKLDSFIDDIKDFVETSYKQDKCKIKYSYHIRNAVAHGRVKFKPKEYVEFRDKKNKHETCTIRIKLKDFGSVFEYLKNIFNKYIEDINNKSKK